MSDTPIVDEGAPIRIVDKREERRLEAEARKAAEETTSPAPVADPEARLAELRSLDRELTEEERAELLDIQVALQPDGDDSQVVEARTAFLVVCYHDGRAVALSDVNTELSIDHLANVDEMYTGAAIVLRDIEASLAAKHVVFSMQVAGQAMAEKAQAVRAMQGLQQPPRRR